MRKRDSSGQAETLAPCWVVLPISLNAKVNQHTHTHTHSASLVSQSSSRSSTPDPALLFPIAKTYGLCPPPLPPSQTKTRIHQTGGARLALPHLTLHTHVSQRQSQLAGGVWREMVASAAGLGELNARWTQASKQRRLDRKNKVV